MTTSEDAIKAMRTALDKSMPSDDLAKAGISTATGLNAYDLRAPALLHIPVITPIREKLARKTRPSPGVACNWKVISGMTGSGIDGMGYIPEGQRSGVKNISTKTALSTYVPLGEEGRITDEAILASQGFEDLQSVDRLLTLEKLMMKEEASLLFGNKSIRLGTPATPTTGTATAAGATLNTTYYVAVVALTAEGYQAASVPGGVVQAMTVTGADGSTFTINGGSSNKSAISAGQAVTTGNALTARTAPIAGAVAYAWYVGTSASAGALNLQAITTINSVNLTSVVTTTQLASAITADCSYNDGTQSGSNPVSAYDGLLTSALVSGSGGYYYPMADGTFGTGTPLTANGSGGIVEIDNMFLSMWNLYRVGVDVLYMSANTALSVSKKMINSTTVRFTKDVNDADGFHFVGGGIAQAYVSPVGNPYNGGKAAIMIHPNLPDGVIVGWASQLPAHYRNNETPAVAEILTRRDYYSIDWPRKTRATEYGVYTDQCLAVYAPWSMGVITNINVN